MPIRTDDVVVVGSGMGGLACALSLAPRSVTLITKTPQLQGGSSMWAQGGIAAAIGPEDSPEAHAVDTLLAGAGLSDPIRTRQLTAQGAPSLHWLAKEGIFFDRDLHGSLALAKEAAHQFPRVAHAGGDTTGKILTGALIQRVHESEHIRVVENTFAYDLVVQQGQVKGLLVFEPDDGWVIYQASNVVLATGGLGMAWWQTTNPVEATGDGLAMAARAGARLADLEFAQFHPTALALETDNGASLPLLTEALRGAGALLTDKRGIRFMDAEHPLAELAPRDVVARAIHHRTQKGEKVFLDLRPVLCGQNGKAFPQALKTANLAGLDPAVDPLPIVPAAHYHMGGIAVDDSGRTSIDGLWACGEVASTGIHGANRLASNSLLEALVYARRVADELSRSTQKSNPWQEMSANPPMMPVEASAIDLLESQQIIRKAMSKYVGLVRNGEDLERAYALFSSMAHSMDEQSLLGSNMKPIDPDQLRLWGETRNLILVSRLVTLAAFRRQESRGAHFRSDYPQPKQVWKRRQSMTAHALFDSH